VSLTPKISLQVYLEPFAGTGRYGNYKEFLKPGTFDFLEYGIDAGTIAKAADGSRVVDPDGRGPALPFELYDGDYEWKTLQTKSVFRWEWRPGSTLYLAWTQARSQGSSADNVFLAKIS
jgi:hypothetical protein